MNQLTKFLVDGILNEGKGKVIAAYGGGFKPPTAGHFEVVKKALEENPEIEELTIFVGGGERDGITQAEAILIWEIYQTYLPMKVNIQPSKAPIGDVIRLGKNNLQDTVYFVIGGREGRDDDAEDIASRTKGIEEKYPNMKVKVVTTPDSGMSGTNARQAAKVSYEEFEKYLPGKLSDEEKEMVYNIVSPAIKEEITKPQLDSIALNENNEVAELESLLNKWSSYSGQYDLLPDIAELAKNLGVNNGPSIVYRAVPGLDDYPYTKQEVIDYDKEQEIVATTPTRKQAEYFITDNADWAYILEYKPHIIINFDEFEKKYGWSGNWGEGEILIDVTKSKLVNIEDYTKKQNINENASFNLDIPKFNYKRTLSERLWHTLNEISLSKENAVEVNGDLTGGNFTVGNIVYEYSIKNISNPYKDLGLFYNIQFTPKEEMTSIPQMGKENYIKILSTMYKIIVDFIEKEKPEYVGISSLDNNGKNYHKVYANLTDNKSNKIPGYFRKDVNLEFTTPEGKGRFIVLKRKKNLNENASYSKDIDLKGKIMQLTQHMLDKGYNIEPLPTVEFVDGDSDNAREFLGKTAYYNPNNQTITLYTEGRHPKDIVRSFSHEMIHHIQNLEGRLGNITTTNTQEDDELNKIEAEANLKGTMTFRNWTDSLNESINEAKQVGLLYHSTYPSTLKNILDQNTLKGNLATYNGKDILAISTTRNKNFKYDGRKAQIVLDGDKLSTKYKIKPYDYWGRDYNAPNNPTAQDEDEELILTSKIPNIKDYIVGINLDESLNKIELKEAIVGDKIECDECGWSWNIVDGGDDLFVCHKCGHDNSPLNEYANSGPSIPKVYIVKDDGTYKEAPIGLLSKISNLTYDMGGGETNYYPGKNIVIVDNIPVEEFAKNPGEIKGEKIYVEYNLNNSTSLPKANKIIASQLVYHLDNREAFAQTVANSLKDGGTFEFQSDLMNKKDKTFLQHLSDEYGFGLPTKLNQYKQQPLPLKKGEFVEPVISYTYKITDKDGKTATLSVTKKGNSWEWKKIDGDIDFKTGGWAKPPEDPDPEFKAKEYTLRSFNKYLSYFGDSTTIVDFEKLNESSKPYKHKHGFDDKLGKDPFGLNQFAREIAEEVINEGRYDALANKLSSIAFESFKDIHDRGDKEGGFEFRIDNPDEEHDIPSKEFYFDFLGSVEITDDEYSVDGGANAGFDSEGEEITPLLSVKFKIPKNPDWQKVSFDIKDVIRHELEHLTQEGDNVKPSKQMEDDQMLRDLIDLDFLPKADYFKLEKEVDAMLQGLYFKAKKAKRPFKDVIDDYLNIFIDQETITQEEKENILDIWRSRGKALSLPIFEQMEDMDYEIYSDMDGVLTDFDASFMKASDGVLPSEYKKNFGYDGFWELIDKKGVGYWVGMPWMSDGKQYWDYIKKYQPTLLSSPSRSSTSRLGKRLWVKNNIPGTKLILAQAKDKQNYAQKNRILIDDRPSNIDQWRASGGIGILHTSAADTIRQLKELGL